MIKFKIDIMEELKKKGYNTVQIRKNKLLGENALQTIRRGGVPGIKSIDMICGLLKKQPGQILEYIPEAVTDPEQIQE